MEEEEAGKDVNRGDAMFVMRCGIVPVFYGMSSTSLSRTTRSWNSNDEEAIIFNIVRFGC